jgi:hypothetical protein
MEGQQALPVRLLGRASCRRVSVALGVVLSRETRREKEALAAAHTDTVIGVKCGK